MAFVELAALTKRYGPLTVVDNVSLSVEKGQMVCLLGPSGCGKTTTLRLLAGFVEPDAGEIRVGDRIISSAKSSEPPERRGMSMIFQNYALWPHMSVFENVAYGLRLRRVPAAELARRVGAVLSATRLEQMGQRYPGELSGGQQQRVALARALVVEPEILLLDEPLSNLDANLREEMRFEIRRLHDAFRFTSVYVTHDQAEAMTTADLIVVMNQGKIEQAGTPSEIYRKPVSRFVAQFIGGANVFEGARAGSDVVDCGDGVALRCAGGVFAPNGPTSVSIRAHDIVLSETAPEPGAINWTRGSVARQTYLGSHRDYLVALAGGKMVRAIAGADVAIAPGQEVWLNLPPAHCWALER